MIALKSSVDSLIIHGVDVKTTLKLQRIIFEDYMVTKDRILRQTTIEGICKMLFSRKLTLDADHNELEFLLSQLIIQWFDRRFNWQNSLVRQILNVFFKSFVLFSQQRCELMLRSLAKVVFSILESKYGHSGKAGGSIKSNSNEKKGKKPKVNVQEKKKKKRAFDDDEDDESSYDINEDDSFVSDDSRCAANQALMQTICSELDALQVSKVFLLLLSKEYVNNNAAKEFQLVRDLPIEFLLIIAAANALKLKKVAVVKEFLVPLVEHVQVGSCSDVIQLQLLSKYIDLNCRMLVNGQVKLTKFKEQVDRRLGVVLQEQQANEVDIIADPSQPQPISQELMEQHLGIFISSTI